MGCDWPKVYTTQKGWGQGGTTPGSTPFCKDWAVGRERTGCASGVGWAAPRSQAPCSSATYLHHPPPCLVLSSAMDGVPFTLHPRFEGKGCGPLVSLCPREDWVIYPCPSPFFLGREQRDHQPCTQPPSPEAHVPGLRETGDQRVGAGGPPWNEGVRKGSWVLVARGCVWKREGMDVQAE